MAGTCRIRAAVVRQVPPGYRTWMSDQERSRLERIRRPVDRDRFLLGTGLVRSMVSELTGLAPQAVPLDRTCAECGSAHGRPMLKGLPWFASISHSGDVVLVAVTDLAPVGVDIERIDPKRLGAIESVMPTADRSRLAGLEGRQRCRAGFQNWVRRESVLKAAGDGLAGPVRELEVGDPASTTALIRYTRRDATPMRVHDLAVGPEYAAAVCIADAAVYSVDMPTSIRGDVKTPSTGTTPGGE